MRIGVLTALALAIHNFPEGIATFVTALDDPELGMTIAVAIAIHNVPEGIAVSMPIYFATGDRKKAFMYSFLSGVVEPLGAIIGYFILMPYLNDTLMGMLLAGVAGIMVFISLDQLLPAAEEYGEHHLSIYGVVLGMIVMAGSLILMM
jgi:ZIP family zinc transporter